MPLSSFSPPRASVVRDGVRRADAGPGAGLAGDRRAASTCCCPRRPARARRSRRSCGRSTGSSAEAPAGDAARARHARGLRQPAEGARVRHRAEPARAAARDRRARTCASASARATRRSASAPRWRATRREILVTTPESLYLILTSQAREMLSGVEAVIVDEIHAVAHSKRGSHLALTLERLEALVRGARPPAGAREIQRIGLSATQNPLEEIGRFLVGPEREVRSRRTAHAGGRAQAARPAHRGAGRVDGRTGERRPDAATGGADPLEPLPGGESTRGSIWPAIYPRAAAARARAQLDDRVRQQPPLRRARRAAPERAGRQRGRRSAGGGRRPPPAPLEIARAHHGSLAREERTKVEELLKAGELPCLVATSSLELGIDMGAVDLVAADRVAEVGRARAAADRARRARRRARSAGGASSRSSAATCSSARSSRGGCTKA